MIQSTFQRIATENAALRRSGNIDRIVYWTCVISVVVLALLKLNGSL